MDIILCDILTHIKAAAHASRIALPPYIPAVLVLLLPVKALCGVDGEIAVLQLHLNLFLLKAGQIDIHHIASLRLLDIGFHQVLCILSVKRSVNIREGRESKALHQIIK